MDDGSQNGHQGGDAESPEDHRAGHLLNMLDEVLAMLVEDSTDEDALDDVIESTLLALMDAVAVQTYRPPRPLLNAFAAWVGTDPRGYLRTTFSDDRGRLADDTPEWVLQYLQLPDEQYWTDE